MWSFFNETERIPFQKKKKKSILDIDLCLSIMTIGGNVLPSMSLFFFFSPPLPISSTPSFLFLSSFTNYCFQQHLWHPFRATMLWCVVCCALARFFQHLSCGVVGFDVFFALWSKSPGNFPSLFIPMVLLVCGFLLLYFFSCIFVFVLLSWLLGRWRK